eukprot:CAMPEP_0114644766 /NCGR_PEP_ID=MMETSP0191-20121206/4154_1 /TAXON_ID=126664 /ORGANISM="Sorites sp." /LENGTH=89 /DNA_ID=CAMNT_0001857273 /DNA_START=2769 /DNA_END=3038 /DNA_ORIENTATION=+
MKQKLANSKDPNAKPIKDDFDTIDKLIDQMKKEEQERKNKQKEQYKPSLNTGIFGNYTIINNNDNNTENNNENNNNNSNDIKMNENNGN